ncbi:hypothetical protein [Heyndrickxia ginsengihumi]|uniref:hypothetical protein n=1 Tax=Heyndrickxia ginsengihumi TaxID=363870 RepID=UPI003D1BE17A
MKYTLRFISILYVLLLSVGLFSHVEIIPALLSTVKRDAWISVILAIFVLFILIFLLYKMITIIDRQSIIELLKDQRKLTYYILLFPISLYLLFNAFITAKDIVIVN